MNMTNFNIRIRLGILCCICLCSFPACDFLERDVQTDTTLSYEEIFSNPHYATGFLNNIYNDVTVGFTRLNYATLAGATDEACISNSTLSVHLFNNNGISPTNNPDDIWYVMYRSIRKCNIFLKELDGIIKESNSISASERITYRGEALFLRALMHFELMKRYQNIVWVDDVIDPYDENSIYKHEQKSFLELAEILSAECDSAAKCLPQTLRTGGELGRPIASAPLALKSRIWLYAASPLNNPENDIELWKKAEQAALDVITQFGSVHGTANDYAPLFNSGTYANEVIFGTEFENRNDLEQYYLPISYSGKGLINPTQELVDEYAMQASSYDDPMKGYDAANPYNKRDARFAATIVYNGMELKSGQYVETYDGGKDAFGQSTTATRTGYYMRKYLKPELDLPKNEKARRQWIVFRYSEILLNYAEARNEVLASPDKEVWTTVNPIRLRGKLRPFPNTGVKFDKEQMREYLKHERRIELAFEEHRFWDLRRWGDATKVLNQPVHGINITKNEDGSFSYAEKEVESRQLDERMIWYPIPQSEILKYAAAGHPLVQNPGW